MKPNKTLALVYLLILIFVCLVAWFGSGCTVAKDNKAFKRVISTPALAERTYRELEKSHPCTSDSVTNIFLGRDSIRTDTVTEMHYFHDTLNNVTPGILKYITKTIARVDTMKKTLADTRRLQIALDSIFYYRGITDVLSKNVKEEKDALTKSIKEERQRGNLWKLRFYGLLSLSLIINLFKLYMKYKNVIPKINIK